MDKNKLTKEDKLVLLKNYLVEDNFVKAIIETLDEKELDKWIDTNLDTMLIKNEREDF